MSPYSASPKGGALKRNAISTLAESSQAAAGTPRITQKRGHDTSTESERKRPRLNSEEDQDVARQPANEFVSAFRSFTQSHPRNPNYIGERHSTSTKEIYSDNAVNHVRDSVHRSNHSTGDVKLNGTRTLIASTQDTIRRLQATVEENSREVQWLAGKFSDLTKELARESSDPPEAVVDLNRRTLSQVMLLRPLENWQPTRDIAELNDSIQALESRMRTAELEARHLKGDLLDSKRRIVILESSVDARIHPLSISRHSSMLPIDTGVQRSFQGQPHSEEGQTNEHTQDPADTWDIMIRAAVTKDIDGACINPCREMLQEARGMLQVKPDCVQRVELYPNPRACFTSRVRWTTSKWAGGIVGYACEYCTKIGLLCLQRDESNVFVVACLHPLLRKGDPGSMSYYRTSSAESRRLVKRINWSK